jgi:hypothetical protein
MRRRLMLCIALAILAAFSLACASEPSTDDGVATLSDDSGDDADDSSRGDDEMTDQEIEEAMLEFAECMRDHGVDMPDPQFEDGGLVRIEAGPGRDIDEDEFEAANEACRKLLPNGGEPPSEEEMAEMEDAMLEFAECMRDHGIDMPDPQGGGMTIGPDDDIDPNDPDFKAADEDCRHIIEDARRVTREGDD